MKGTKISVLIPVKNEADFIIECLNSIQEQTISDWEVIVVDDHSSDNTVSLIKAFTEKDQRFKFSINQGSGIIDSLRTAYRLSVGNMITRMDGDDIMTADKLEILSSNLEQSGKGNLAVGGVNYFSDDRVKSGFKNYEEWLNSRTAGGTNFNDIFRECPIPSPNWMIYKSDLDECGAFNSNRYPEDYDLAFRMFLNGLTVIPCQKITHHWRDYPTRTSRTHDHYKDHTFTQIKWHYFENYFKDDAKQLVVFGTGYRGKKLAAHLIDQGVEFQWVSHNPEKIGKHIYDVMIESLASFDWSGKQIIATIAKDKGRNQVNKMAIENGLQLNSDLIHFA